MTVKFIIFFFFVESLLCLIFKTSVYKDELDILSSFLYLFFTDDVMCSKISSLIDSSICEEKLVKDLMKKLMKELVKKSVDSVVKNSM